jgi:hypothetical protein
MNAETIHIVTPTVIRVRASVESGLSGQLEWRVGYAPERDTDGRYLLARLYAANGSGRVCVELSAMLVGGDTEAIEEEYAEDGFKKELVASHALDSLYSLARLTAHGLLGTITTPIELPASTPTPAVSRLVRTESTTTSAEA